MTKPSIAGALALLAVLTSSAVAAPYKSADLFPMNAGDYAVYEVTPSAGTTYDRRVEVKSKRGSWYQVKGHPFGASPTSSSSYANLASWFVQSTTTGTKRLVRSDARAGDSWRVSSLNTCLRSGTIRLTSTAYDASTPAGYFQGCLLYAVAGNCADAGVTSFAVYPGLGIVAWTETSIAGPIAFNLKEAQVGGTKYPLAPTGYTVRGSTDRAAYQPTVRPPVTPSGPVTLAAPEIKASLTIENPSATDLVIRHTSGQKYDFSIAPIADPTKPVYVWSAGKAFTMALTTTTVPAGGSVTYTETLPATDGAGALLPAGLYVVRGWTANDQSFSFEATIEIKTP